MLNNVNHYTKATLWHYGVSDFIRDKNTSQSTASMTMDYTVTTSLVHEQ